MLWAFGCLVVSLHCFSHSGFGVERFMRINDENAITYPSTNVNHCIGLFLTFCKTVSKSTNENDLILLVAFISRVKLLKISQKNMIFQRPNCIGFSVSKSNRLCKLSDYAEGWSLADDDAYDAYPKISDNVLNSPEGGGGNILIATPLITPESRTTTTTSPRSNIISFLC